MTRVNHPVVVAAAEGALPSWAVAGEARRAHMDRVAALMTEWAARLELSGPETERWRAVSYLHDALREAPVEALRSKAPPALARLPDQVLHGPVAAEKLRVGGVLDGELLAAVAYHTIGHASLGRLGRALYAADFLEPGRDFELEWRAALRGRMPSELDTVVREILAARLKHLLDRGLDLLPQTVAFWNRLAREP